MEMMMMTGWGGGKNNTEFSREVELDRDRENEWMNQPMAVTKTDGM